MTQRSAPCSVPRARDTSQAGTGPACEPTPRDPTRDPTRPGPPTRAAQHNDDQASFSSALTHTLRNVRLGSCYFLKRPEPPFQDWGTGVPNTSPPCPSRTCPDVFPIK
ncbi:hypothetical protein CSOJ01_08706 [Colletotrichum sojae]|uniref:Uncharacterized protein n=1 Tax=Colletotrichum sojae TaxID=2175907 RepID=A0A8H6J5Z0_9PEZI|nr:hypothetical protein CSOJ01_08706 [Colletotrichum sojae]